MAQKYIIGSVGSPVAFDASLAEQEMSVNAYTEELQIALHGLQNGGVAPTIADLLASWNTIAVIYGGDPIVNIRAADLLAIMVLWLKRNPITIISGADNERLNLSGLSLPLWTGPDSSTLKVRATRVAPPATLDTLRHTIMQRYAPVRPQDRPVYLKYLQQSFTPPATAGYRSAGTYENAGTIVGMLIFSTTIPVAGADTTSARGIRISGTGIDELEFDWFAGGADQRYVATRASPGDLTILDNYRLWDLSKTPIPPKTNPKIEVFADDTNEVRLIPIEQVPL